MWCLIVSIPDLCTFTYFNTIKKNMPYAKGTIYTSIILSIQYVHGDLCKHLGIDSSTDHPDRSSNLFLNAYIIRHVHAEYLKMT